MADLSVLKEEIVFYEILRANIVRYGNLSPDAKDAVMDTLNYQLRSLKDKINSVENYVEKVYV